MPQETLAQRVRAKYPGAYDDLDDVALERQVRAKFPGVYDDVPSTPTTGAASPLPDPTAARLGPAPSPTAPAPPAESPGLLQEIASAFLDVGRKMNPVPGLVETVKNPAGVGRAILDAQGQQFTDAQAAFDEGRYGDAAAKMLAYLIPVLGPAGAAITEKFQSGQPADALNDVTALIGSAALPGAKVPVRAGANAAINATERAAIEFGRARGVPIDAATATGSRVVRGVQSAADRSFLGGSRAEQARRAQETALSRVGRDLAHETNAPRPGVAGPAVTPVQAGEGVGRAVDTRIGQYHAISTRGYDRLREIEADPKNQVTVQTGTRLEDTGVLDASGQPVRRQVPITETIALPVDLRAAKRALQPVYDRWMRQMPVTVQRSSPGFKSIENIVKGPDYAPASVVDADLSAIKGITREADGPQLRDVSEGFAARAVSQLESAVQAAVAKGGREATAALDLGRGMTRAKYAAADVLDRLRGNLSEPHTAYSVTTRPNDAAIANLREVARLAPEEVRNIGRAYLEEMLTKATAEGGFGRASGLWADWQRLGPETKAILYPDLQHRRALDNFFLLAKRVGENPNPSGSGHQIWMGAQGLAFAEPVTGVALQITLDGLSRLMHSPAGVRALTKGLSVPVGTPAAFGGLVNELMQLAGPENVQTQGGQAPVRPIPRPALAGAR